LNPEPGTLNTERGSSNSEQSSYRQIFKATSLFGGVQVFNILIGIIRVKFVAVLLGTKGVGIIGLLNSPLELITSITGLGISFSAVRDVSEAQGTGDQTKIARTITALRRWSWFTGLLGAFATITLAPLLSQWSFGSREYTWAFIWLSITLLLQAISKGQSALLQGTRRLKEMAKAGVIGSVLGLITSIPLYYWLGIKGIVSAFIITGVTGLLLSWYFSHKVVIEKVQLTNKETYFSGLRMAKLGVSMTIAGFVASLSAYILNAFISNKGGVEQVGLYNAGWGVVGQYTAIIFAAMATDYFPRLSAVQADNDKVKKLVNQQVESALLIVSPLLVLLIVLMPIVVRILYTPAFLPVVMFAILTVLGIPFKAVSWAMGYVYLARGDGKLFLTMEIISGSVILALNLLFYHLYGLNGLGISFIITYLLGVIFSYLVLRWKYAFDFPDKFLKKFSILYGFVLLTFLTVFIQDIVIRFIAGILILIPAVFYSFHKLDELMDIKSFITAKIKR
jgi:O-antigen/teichoic acid export membrane protein